MRRIRILRFTPDLIVLLCRDPQALARTAIVENALPADAKLVPFGPGELGHWDYQRCCFAVLVESASFEPVPEGDRIPEHNTVFRDTAPPPVVEVTPGFEQQGFKYL